MKTSELTGDALDWAVVRANYEINFEAVWLNWRENCRYSTDWSEAGPIIEREGIEIRKGNDLYFPHGNEKGDYCEPLWIAGKQHGQSPLIAAMRCYVASKLGDDVNIPNELFPG